MEIINILGTDYTIKYQNETENPKLVGNDGLCETFSKELVLREFETTNDMLDNIDKYKEKVLRHEVIHGFFFESGLDCNSDFGRNEELVDWIAIQFPKMYRVFKELGVLE